MKIFAPHAKDFYKASHPPQYPEKTQKIYANFTPRSGKLSNVPSKGVVFIGLQYFILDYLIKDWNESFFEQSKDIVCNRYQRRISNALGKNIDVKHFEKLHDLGYLPLLIKALPEGYVVPYGVPVLTITNTVDEFYWIPNMIESVISADLWGICTSATTSNAYRKLFRVYAAGTEGDDNFIPYQGHDFAFRGMFGKQATALSGFGHLSSGMCGTDSILAIDFAEQYYGANSDEEVVGTSVDATEHSVMCSGIGMYEDEISKGEHDDVVNFYLNFKRN